LRILRVWEEVEINQINPSKILGKEVNYVR